MLVLSRKAGQRIQIGDNVFVSVTAIKGNRITLGIEAPAEVAVRRGELIPLPTAAEADPCIMDEAAQRVA